MTEQPISVLDSVAASRANVYYALARALEPPRNWKADSPQLLAGAMAAMPEPLPELGERLASQVADLLEDREQVEVAHAKLFLGPFKILVAPWACYYLEDGPKLMGPTSHYAAQAYADAGLAPNEKLKDTPDHVTHELEFMYYLAFSQATTEDTVWQDRQVRFWREHLGRWLPRFADALAEAAVHPFYDMLAETLKGVCALEAEEL
jgi:TorA maturation chaperone TorD